MSGLSERNPYVGPRPIQQGEPLHGRKTEIRELFNLLQARRIVVLHSPSGAGKSSLVQAGLIPRLTEAKFDVWKPIRVNLDPQSLDGVPPGTNRYLLSAMVSLEEELPAGRRRSPAQLASLDLTTYIKNRPRRRAQADSSVVLIFDQFEELLTAAPLAIAEKSAFFTALGEALADPAYWALFIVREDFLAAFSPYRDLVPTHLANTFRLDLLSLAGAREAAQQPALAAGRTFPAVDRLVRDLSMIQTQQVDGTFRAEPGLHVEPVQLQVVCRRLWQAMPDDDLSIDEEDIATYADVSTALAGYYAATVEKTSGGDVAVERAIREWIGDKLIVGGTRSQVRREAGKSAGLDNRLIQQLLNSYLVRIEPRAGAQWYELSHDRMVEPIQRDNTSWEQTHLHPLQVQARLWEDGHRPAALLLGSEALRDARLWAEANPTRLTESEQEFLAQSQARRAADQAARRRLVVLATAAAVVAVVVGVLGVVAYLAQREAVAASLAAEAQAKRAEDEKRRAQEESWKATESAVRARDASLMAGARELLAAGQPGAAIQLLLEVQRPEAVREWLALARDTLETPSPVASLVIPSDVVSVRWSPDSRRVLFASVDRTLRIWSADGIGMPILLQGHTDSIDDAAWNPDSRHILTSSGGTARVCTVDGAHAPVILAGDGRTAAWSPDGEHALIVDGNTVWVGTPDGAGGPVLRIDEDTSIHNAAWSPDGERIVCAASDGTARIFRADGTGKQTILRGHRGELWVARWSPDGKRILTKGPDELRVWSGEGNGKSIKLGKASPRGGDQWWSRDSERILSVGAFAVSRWNADGTGKPIILERDMANMVDVNPDGHLLLTVEYSNPVVQVRELEEPDKLEESDEPPLILSGHTDRISRAVWSPVDDDILTTSEDGTARIWIQGEPAGVLKHTGAVEHGAWSPDGQRVVTVDQDGIARIWYRDYPTFSNALDAWSPDGRRFADAWGDTAWVWTPDESSEPITLDGPTTAITSLEWSPDGRHLAITANDGVWVWGADGGQPRAVQGDQVLGWSSDCRQVIVSADRTVQAWDLDETHDPIHIADFEDHLSSVTSSPDQRRLLGRSFFGPYHVFNTDGTGRHTVIPAPVGFALEQWSPDGQRILITSRDTVQVWNADGAGEPVVLDHTSAVGLTAWSPDSRRFVTATNRQVYVWNADGTVIDTRKFPAPVDTTTWSPDGQRIVTATRDGAARVWSPDSCGETVLAHENEVESAAWSLDGRRIVTLSGPQIDEDGRDISSVHARSARIWNVDGTGDAEILDHGGATVRPDEWSADARRIFVEVARGPSEPPFTDATLGRYYRSLSTECLTPELRRTYLDETDVAARTGSERCERAFGRVPSFLAGADLRVSFYEKTDFQGAVESVEGGGWNRVHRTGSVRVPAGLRVKLRDDRERALETVITADKANLRNKYSGNLSELVVKVEALVPATDNAMIDPQWLLPPDENPDKPAP